MLYLVAALAVRLQPVTQGLVAPELGAREGFLAAGALLGCWWLAQLALELCFLQAVAAVNLQAVLRATVLSELEQCQLVLAAGTQLGLFQVVHRVFRRIRCSTRGLR